MNSIVSKIAMPAVTEPPGELMYRLMSRLASSADSSSSCAQIWLAIVSSTGLAEEDDSLAQQPVVDRVVEGHAAADTPHVDCADRLVKVTPALAAERGFWGHGCRSFTTGLLSTLTGERAVTLPGTPWFR